VPSKDLKRLDKQTQARIGDALRQLVEHEEGDVTRLTDVRPPEWRLRVGDWRVRFRKHLDEQMLEILHVRHRSQPYDR